MTPSPRWIPGLAFVSGVPGLAYQVVWTREVGLLAGSGIVGVSLVVAIFFGGLAVGAAVFGRLADRVSSPLRLYAGLELVSGAAAALSTFPLRALGPDGAGLDGGMLFFACAALLFPVAVLLGGTLPALLRVAAVVPEVAARQSGRVVGANTLGALTGVALAVALIPSLGLAACVQFAGLVAMGLGVLAFCVNPAGARASSSASREDRVRVELLVAAGIVGAATLGTEVLATRLAMLRLGSSLYAWGSVLGIFLAGLALGNLVFSGRSGRSRRPTSDLGWVEIAIASLLPLAMAGLAPVPGVSPAGLVPGALAAVFLTVFPPALLMGGAFPLLVRLGVRGPGVGASFGAVSAANTLGGVAGALLVPFVLLPALGSLGVAGFLAVLNAGVGWVCLGLGGARHPGRDRAVGTVVFGLATALAVAIHSVPSGPRVIFLADDPQAHVVVTSAQGDRFLWVDGEPEASTAGDARRTEVLLAVLPLLLHPQPRTFLEVGLGSGITLGTASRFPLERIECVEIAQPVIRAAALFAPDNQEVSERATEIHEMDARVFLVRNPEVYDVIAANTLHPWSVGATGLYSVEYFERIAGALQPGGVVAQWVPVAQISAESVASVLATFFSVFPEGGVWWGAGNLLLVGSDAPLSIPEPEEWDTRLRGAGLAWRDFGLEGPDDLRSRWLSSAAGVREALSDRALLRDDLPVLERGAAGPRTVERSTEVHRLLAAIAGSPVAGAMPGVGFWLESLAARGAGDPVRADRRERLAAELGFAEADRAWARRLAEQGRREFSAGDLDAADQRFEAAAALRPALRSARMGAVAVAAARGDLHVAADNLENWLATHPMDAGAWNELAGVRSRLGDSAGAQDAVVRALDANPFYPEALANAGLLAAREGDRATAAAMQSRLRALAPRGTSPEERRLSEALE